MLSRRTFLGAAGAAVGAGLMARCRSAAASPATEPAGGKRRFHLCLGGDNPELLRAVREARISKIWMTGFFYGHWPVPLEEQVAGWRRVEAAGMEAASINLPLGHPGDALGAKSGNFPLTPPKHWKLGTSLDGQTHAGTSLHAPATQENVAAIRKLREAGGGRCFWTTIFAWPGLPEQSGGAFAGSTRSGF